MPTHTNTHTVTGGAEIKKCSSDTKRAKLSHYGHLSLNTADSRIIIQSCHAFKYLTCTHTHTHNGFIALTPNTTVPLLHHLQAHSSVDGVDVVPGTLLVTQLLFYSTTGAHGQLGQMVYLLKYCWDGGSEQDLKQLSMTFSNKYVCFSSLTGSIADHLFYDHYQSPPPFFCCCRNTQRVLQQVFPGKTLHFTVNLQKNLSFLQNKRTENLSQEVPQRIKNSTITKYL